MVSLWEGCWGCSCSAIVDASAAARSVLFVGSVQPMYGVAAVWVSFKFGFVFPGSCVCCQSASSVCVSPRHQWPSHWAVQQVQVVSREKNANSCLLVHWTTMRILHWDTTDILTSQLLKGLMKQCKFLSESMRSAAVTQAFVPVESPQNIRPPT